VKLYHLTYREAAEEIRSVGFGHATSHAGTTVWFASKPEDIIGEGIDGDTWLTLDVPDRRLDVPDPYKYRRGWMLPAGIADRYGSPTIMGPPK
jgi:hypothetical protein